MIKNPPGRHYMIEDRGDTLRLSIPVPKIWFSLLPWGGMVAISICSVAIGEPSFLALFGVFGLLLIIWNFLREQVVEVSDKHFMVWDRVLGVRLHVNHYLAEEIRELRISAQSTNGMVAFDYGSATVTLGRGLDSTEAGEIISKIQRRFPRYRWNVSDSYTQLADAYGKMPFHSPGMTKGIEAPAPRHRSEILGNLLVITIPSRKKWHVIIFLMFWLIGWSIGGILAIRAVTSGKYEVFLILWLVIWFFGEVIVIYQMLWQLFGEEKIEVTSHSITLRQSIMGIGRSKKYTSEHIKRIRVAIKGSEEPYALADEGVTLSKGIGLIAFDYEDKTIRMGIGIEEAEAKFLVANIQRLYPEYIDKRG